MNWTKFVKITYFFQLLILLSARTAMALPQIEAQDLLEYHNLKDDKYDFSIIDRAHRLLEELNKNPSRPQHCPLYQSTGKGFSEKLHQLALALQATKCGQYTDGFLGSFSSSVAKLGQMHTTIETDEAVSASGAFDPDPLHYRNVHDMIGSLSGLVSDARCALDIKERGLIPVIAEILGSASVASLYVPNQHAYLGGLAGLGVTSLLKIIASLLQPNFDMNVTRDRENFIRLACSFHDVRSDLERSNFLRIPSDRDVVHQMLVESYLEVIDSILHWLKETKRDSLAMVALYRDEFAIQEIGLEKVNFYRDLPELKKALAADDTEGAPARSLDHHEKLKATLSRVVTHLYNVKFDNVDVNEYCSYCDLSADISLLLNYNKIFKDPSTRKKSDKELSAMFVTALENIEAILAQKIRTTTQAFHAQKLGDGTTYGALVEDINDVFDSHVTTLTSATETLTEKNDVLLKIIARHNFTAEDEGTHVNHTIIEEVKTIESTLFGRDGWRFFRYVRDAATKELSAFHTNYYAFYNKYLPKVAPYVARITDENQRLVACATASHIMLSIYNSRSLVNMGTDFIFTNRDFFHEDVPEIDLRFYFVPTGTSTELKLLAEAESVVKTKALLANNKLTYFPPTVNLASTFNKPSIGDLMMAQTYADRRVLRLQRFQEINQCNR